MKTKDIYCTYDKVDNVILNVETIKSEAEIFTNNKVDELVTITKNKNSVREITIDVAKWRFTTCTLDDAVNMIRDYITDINTEHDESY